VFSGHYHGGQWNLQFIGGVYAPYIGFNPPFVKGVYKGEYATIILSSGLGNEHRYIPRINNPPEIVVVDIKPEK
jgi:predicted MPP superfamily phosphohydrolase